LLAVSVDVTHNDIQTPAAHGHSMDDRPIPTGEMPRAEPEIIPPGDDDRQSRSSTARIRVFIDGGGIRHIYFAQLGPLGSLVFALMIGILSAMILFLVLGAFLVWISLIGLLVAVAIASGLIRRYFRQPP
jgi:hypothetical protein